MKHSDETCLFTECSRTTLYSSHRPNDNDATDHHHPKGAPMIAAALSHKRRTVRIASMIGSSIIVLLVLGAAPMASAGEPTCFGRTATILGTGDAERIQGTSGSDVIIGLGGRDIIFAAEGDDFVCGNDGGDVIDGGLGNDRMSGGIGPDFVTGVDGNDLILGGRGADTLNFGDEEDGDDEVSGGKGDDDLHAGVGADRLFGNSGDDTLAEGEVDAPLVDLFTGGLGTDTCFAGAEDTVRSCEVTS